MKSSRLRTAQSSSSNKIKKLLITAGPTREMLDPVRFISNLSTGELGYKLARLALKQGYEVTLISGPTAFKAIDGVKHVPVVSSEDMRVACLKYFKNSDALIMTAAVADFTPAHRERQKIKRRETQSVVLKRTKDILAELGPIKGDRLVIGFCLETEKWLEYAKLKLLKKKMTGIVANYYEPGKVCPFGHNPMTSVFMDADLSTRRHSNLSKLSMAKKILSWMEELARAQKNL